MRLDIIAFLTATLIAFRARANGELSHLLGNSIQAATVSFGSGLILIAIVTIIHHETRLGMRNVAAAVRAGKLQ